MNKWLLGVAIGFIVLLVLLGPRHPLDEARKARMERKGDSLISKIEEHNKKSHGFMAHTGPNGSIQFNPGATMRQPMQRNSPNSPYTSPYSNPYRPAQPAPSQPAMTPATPPSYYPPAPAGTAGSPLQQQGPAAAPSLPSQPGPQSSLTNGRSFIKTPTGQPIRFRGTRVYTLDSNGNEIPMPDGNYPVFDGRGSIIVHAGKHIIVNN